MPTPRSVMALRATSLTTYDLSDALHALSIPFAGHLVDIAPISLPIAATTTTTTAASAATTNRIIGLASPVQFASKHSYPPSPPPTFTGHYADAATCSSDHILVLSQPAGQRCAVLGGLIAARLAARRVAGIVVGGRVRDVRELQTLGIPVWAAGRSTVGAGAEAVCVRVGGEVEVAGVKVYEGDVVVADEGGVVVVPECRVEDVVRVAKRAVGMDEKVMADVLKGRGLAESMKEHRTKL